jgi:hypothetical protein
VYHGLERVQIDNCLNKYIGDEEIINGREKKWRTLFFSPVLCTNPK